MVVHGSVTHDETNVYCTGAKFTIEGEQHSNMLSFETIRLSMVELSIQVGDQKVQELKGNDHPVTILRHRNEMYSRSAHLPYH